MTDGAKQIESARSTMAAVGAIIDAMEPLDLEDRKRVLAAVLCLEYEDCADAAIGAFQRRTL